MDSFKEYLDKALTYYHSDDKNLKYFGRIPKSRYHTFKFCTDYIVNKNFKSIVELGTSRSFVDGRFEGCNSDDIKYWEPNNMEKWDWSAGCFTKVFSSIFSNSQEIKIHTVDIASSHINRCRYMNKDANNIIYHIDNSINFLNNYNGKIDVLYLDTGDMTPINETSKLQLEEAKIIVKRNLISDDGLILIDDVRSCVPLDNGENVEFGKGCLSIKYLIENGFDMVMDEYQTILKKTPVK
jgi:hypothetical protein